MISNQQLQEIAKRAGINPQSFIEAIAASEEKTVDLSNEGAFLTIEESQAIEARGKKSGYEEGKTAGYEILTKEVKRLAEVEFEGKTAQNVVNALKDKFASEASKEPNKAIEDLTKDKQKLQSLLTEKENELNTVKIDYEGKLTKLTVESKVMSLFPDKLENGLSREDLFTLYQNQRKIQRTETGIELIDPLTNEVIKDRKLNPVSVEEDIPLFLQRFGFVQEGRGGGDVAPKTGDVSTFKKRSEVESYFEKNGTPLNEQAGILAKAMKNEGFNISE